MPESPSHSNAVSLDQLIALNDEILALVRAGVPLERGLSGAAGDAPARLKTLLDGLSRRLERGETLAEAVANSEGFPPVYRGVVEAGIRGGHLPAALQSMASTARRVAELRRSVSLAILYPLLVLLIAYGLFIFFLVQIAPVLDEFTADRISPLGFQWARRMGETALLWGPVLPAVLLGVIALWWYRSGRAGTVGAPAAFRAFGWIPTVGRLARNMQHGTFAEILQMLLRQRVPLPKSLQLAAEATGSPELVAGAARMGAAIEEGQRQDQMLSDPALPQFLTWLLVSGLSQEQLPDALQRLADVYRRRAQRQAQWLRLYWPLILTLGIGGTVTLLYTLALFLPWTYVLHQLSISWE